MFKVAADPARCSAKLTWTTDGNERVLQLGDDLQAVTIGRSSSSEVQLEDGQVSRLHAQIVWDGYTWLVRDLGSRNGTRVGPVHAGAGLALEDGDTVHCGRVALGFSWPAGAVQTAGSSQPETVTGSILPPFSAAETTLLQELCRSYRRGEDPRTATIEPTSNAELAERLRLSDDGVRQRLKRLYPKLGLSGGERQKRRELAARAIELGIVRPGPADATVHTVPLRNPGQIPRDCR
jgi:hypothetical protein